MLAAKQLPRLRPFRGQEAQVLKRPLMKWIRGALIGLAALISAIVAGGIRDRAANPSPDRV